MNKLNKYFPCRLQSKNVINLFLFWFIEEVIIEGIHGENPPLMKTRKKNCYRRSKIIVAKIIK